MSRLYPGWGSGKNTSLEETLAVYPVGSIGRSDLEGGDKVILPQSMFRTVSRMKLPFPLTFEVSNPRIVKNLANNSNTTTNPTRGGESSLANKKKRPTAIPGPATPASGADKQKKKRAPPARQFCGVMEFSGPEGKAFVPQWMMQNLRLKESQKIQFKSVSEGKLPHGTLCRLQPHTTAFIDLAASMDLRELLEHAFRNYSVLSTGQTLVVSVAGENYKINVVETQPEPAISLYGNLDLEVDFAPPLDQPDVGKMRPSSRERSGSDREDEQVAHHVIKNGSNNNTHARSQNNNNSNIMGGFSTDEQLAALAQQALQTVSQAALSSVAACKNQTPSLISSSTATPQGHVWGAGRSLNGASTATDASQIVAAGMGAENSSEQNPSQARPRARRRKPSRFAQRTAGSSFVGEGAPVEETEGDVSQTAQSSQTTEEDSTASPQFVAFSGAGRKLSSAGQDPALSSSSNAAEPQSKPSREALREQRMQFLRNLEKQREADLEDAQVEQPIAVGSSLNAIRKHQKLES